LKKPRRLIVGDIHGCADELAELLYRFKFIPGHDRLFCVGDVVGKGPKAREALELLRQFGARITLGNHEQHLLDGAALPPERRTDRHARYLASLGSEREFWLGEIASWPLYIEEPDLLIVHAGLEPGVVHPSRMRRKVLLNIRTWDGTGANLDRQGIDPPWFELVSPGKPVIFGHWAERGLLDLPDFKGLDTGCVYGRELSAWCPEENRFHHVKARKAYAEVK
jgi:hypothetical protein